MWVGRRKTPFELSRNNCRHQCQMTVACHTVILPYCVSSEFKIESWEHRNMFQHTLYISHQSSQPSQPSQPQVTHSKHTAARSHPSQSPAPSAQPAAASPAPAPAEPETLPEAVDAWWMVWVWQGHEMVRFMFVHDDSGSGGDRICLEHVAETDSESVGSFDVSCLPAFLRHVGMFSCLKRILCRKKRGGETGNGVHVDTTSCRLHTILHLSNPSDALCLIDPEMIWLGWFIWVSKIWMIGSLVWMLGSGWHMISR